MKKLKTFDSSYFIGKSNFEDGTQNYLVFQSINIYFKVIANAKYIWSWKSKGLSDETIRPPATSDNSLPPLIDYRDNKIRLKFNRDYLKQPKLSYTHGTIVNIYIVYAVGASSSYPDDSILKNSLFGAVRLTKNADINKYQYSGYRIGFDRKSSFWFPSGGFGQNVIVFGANMSSSVHVDNKRKDILILGKGQTQELEHILPAEKTYSIDFTEILLKLAL